MHHEKHDQDLDLSYAETNTGSGSVGVQNSSRQCVSHPRGTRRVSQTSPGIFSPGPPAHCKVRGLGGDALRARTPLPSFCWSLPALLFLCVPHGLPAQHNGSAATGTGVVEGRAFGITKGGDLKPARMPTVYLFYKGRGGKLDKGTSDEHYQDTFMSAYKRRLDQRIDNPSDSDENLQCREDLLDIDTSINDTLHWALDNHKEKQILVADGDEEG